MAGIVPSIRCPDHPLQRVQDLPEDPDLVNELQAAGVEYSGTRPSALSQFLMAWVLPLLVMFGLWSLLASRFKAAGEGVLGIDKSRAS